MRSSLRRKSPALAFLPVLLAIAVFALPVRLAGQQPAGKDASQVTYAKDIAPILQRSCQACHRPGSVAPMSLVTYNDVRPWARSIKARTALAGKPNGMPPWFIDKTVGIQKYKGDISLSDEEIEKIARWTDAGAPRGNPADEPPPLKFVGEDEWQIGKPDLIVSGPAVAVKATSPDWWGPLASVATGLTEDRYIAAVEMKEVSESKKNTEQRATIGGNYIFHHLIWSVMSGDGSRPSADQTAGWPVHEVGRNADIFDPKAGRLMKAGSTLLFPSTHMHANGVDTSAHIDFAFKFHPKEYQPLQRVAALDVTATLDLDIRPMEANQKIEAFSTLTDNVKMSVFEPHMHAAGVRMCLDAIYGSTIETLSCAGYNHGWVRVYSYAEDAAPLLPKGTILRVTGYFDNTPGNKNVVDPRNWSGLGHRSIDNMMINIGQVIVLTDEQFQREITQRREKLHLTEGQTVLGCPLCGYSKLPTAPAQQQQP
jgi:mono/diheme cytochrome c family protein